jgi:4-amino-4-deoxy-L-arabinose transferase-like glycosyltransferase
VGEPARSALTLALVAYTLALALYFAIVEGPGRLQPDMAEAYAWGQEFQLGYNQHPPFWAWIAGAWFRFLPHEIWVFGLLSAINAGVGLAGAYAASGHFLKGDRRVAALALCAITPCFSLMAFKYNANVIFISLWPWTLYAFLNALARRRLTDSLTLGALAGFSLLSKYSALAPLAVLALAAWLVPEGRRYWRSASPWISALVAAALFLPHGIWLMTTGAPPLKYLATQSGLGFATLARDAMDSLLGALGIAAPALFVSLLLARGALSVGLGDARRKLLIALALGPLILTFAIAFALRTRIYPQMLVGLFPLWPTLVVSCLDLADARAFAKAANRLAVAAVAAALALAAPISFATARLSARAKDVTPYREAAEAAERLWRDHGDAPLVYVGGARAFDEAAAFYSPSRPHALVNLDYSASLWVTPAEIAEHGILMICPEEAQLCLQRADELAGDGAWRAAITPAHSSWGAAARAFPLVVLGRPPAAP